MFAFHLPWTGVVPGGLSPAADGVVPPDDTFVCWVDPAGDAVEPSVDSWRGKEKRRGLRPKPATPLVTYCCSELKKLISVSCLLLPQFIWIWILLMSVWRWITILHYFHFIFLFSLWILFNWSEIMMQLFFFNSWLKEGTSTYNFPARNHIFYSSQFFVYLNIIIHLLISE